MAVNGRPWHSRVKRNRNRNRNSKHPLIAIFFQMTANCGQAKQRYRSNGLHLPTNRFIGKSSAFITSPAKNKDRCFMFSINILVSIWRPAKRGNCVSYTESKVIQKRLMTKPYFEFRLLGRNAGTAIPVLDKNNMATYWRDKWRGTTPSFLKIRSFIFVIWNLYTKNAPPSHAIETSPSTARTVSNLFRATKSRA